MMLDVRSSFYFDLRVRRNVSDRDVQRHDLEFPIVQRKETTGVRVPHRASCGYVHTVCAANITHFISQRIHKRQVEARRFCLQILSTKAIYV